MTRSLHEDVETALTEALAQADGQSREFKRRLRKLVENAAAANLRDDDVLDVIALVEVDLEED